MDASIRRVRWFAIPFVFIQFGLYTPPAGVDLPFPRWPVAAAFAVVLVGINLVARHVATTSEDAERLRRVGWLTTLVDTTLMLTTVILFGFDESTRIWPVLAFAMVEGVMRGALRGGLLVWGYTSIVYAADQILRLPGRDDPTAWIGSIPFAIGILAFIAVGSGTLEDRARAAHARAEAEADRLRELATVARSMSAARRSDEVFEHLVRSAVDVTGCAAAAFYERQQDDAWILRAVTGIELDAERLGQPSDLPLSQLISALDGPSEVPIEGELQGMIDDMAPHVRTVYAVPIVRGAERFGLLLLGDQRQDRPLVPQLRDVLDVFASDAAVAVRNARLSAVEERTIAELRELDRLKDDFVAILTHDLRSPMTAIAGYAHLLEHRWEDVPGEQRTEYLRAISRGTHRLSALIQDMLDASQAEDTALPVHPEVFDPVELIEEVIDTELHAKADHRCALEVAEGTPQLYADPKRLTQVMHNLVSNAIKYSPDGGRVDIRVGPGRPGYVRIAVSDQGLGMDPRDVERLFTKFSRFHESLRINGTGLGLYLSAALVDAMGGSFEVSSTVGEGSTFAVLLPAAPATPPGNGSGSRG